MTMRQYFTSFCHKFFSLFNKPKNSCNLSYIPKRLHWGNKEIIQEFYQDEFLFWRSKNKNSLPYSSITLSDISFNRSGPQDKPISIPEDVLWNLNKKDSIKKFPYEIVTLSIKKGNWDTECKKQYQFPEPPKNGEEFVEMHLIHDPLPCNYSHAMFIFFYKGEQVPFSSAQYEAGFGDKKNKNLKKLRQICRDELHKMMIRKEVEFP